MLLADEDFDALITAALNALPEDVALMADLCVITVEPSPSPEILQSVGVRSDREVLLGCYVGLPFGKKRTLGPAHAPDRILIFQEPILARCATTDDVVELVTKVIYHELGHAIGLDHDCLDQLGLT